MTCEDRQLTVSASAADLREVTRCSTTTAPPATRRQLIFPSQITGVTNTDHGIVVSFTCWCGSEQTWLTGHAAAAPARLTLRPDRLTVRGLTPVSRPRSPTPSVYFLGGLPGPDVSSTVRAARRLSSVGRAIHS